MSGERVAVIGGGVSGIAAADSLQRLGFRPTIFERGNRAGGQWTNAYLGARLQNTWEGYEFVSYSWKAAGIVPDRHPTKEQILKYVNAAVVNFSVDMRLNTEVIRMEESKNGTRAGWTVFTRHFTNQAPTAADDQVDIGIPRKDHPGNVNRQLSGSQNSFEFFDYVMIATGLFSEKIRPTFSGQSQYRGKIMTGLNLNPRAEFSKATKNGVVVVGMGKTALDLAVFAAREGAPCTLVFREARWLIPDYILGLVSYSRLLFSRAGGSAMVPCWSHPDLTQRLVHTTFSGLVYCFWVMLGAVMKLSHYLEARKGMPPKNMTSAVESAQARLSMLCPRHELVYDFRSAIALAPDSFFSDVARGAIVPHRGAIQRFSANGVLLDDGTYVPCDTVALGTGSSTASAPFLPREYARIFQDEQSGLYRHVIHPDIPRVAWSGMNHGFGHLSAVEVGVVWAAAVWRGEIDLPSSEAMRASMERVRAWKTYHCASEPCMPYNVNTRYQAYNDTLCRELGISVYRKLPNILSELCAMYTPADYSSVVSEYNEAKSARGGRPLPSINVDM